MQHADTSPIGFTRLSHSVAYGLLLISRPVEGRKAELIRASSSLATCSLKVRDLFEPITT